MALPRFSVVSSSFFSWKSSCCQKAELMNEYNEMKCSKWMRLQNAFSIHPRTFRWGEFWFNQFLFVCTFLFLRLAQSTLDLFLCVCDIVQLTLCSYLRMSCVAPSVFLSEFFHPYYNYWCPSSTFSS